MGLLLLGGLLFYLTLLLSGVIMPLILFLPVTCVGVILALRMGVSSSVRV